MTAAVMYLRVSGDGQISGDGFPRQREACEKYAAANDIELVAEYRDEGITGKMEMENREGLSTCIAAVREQGITLVIVEDSTRLARDLIVAEVLIREFQKSNVRVISASGGIDLTEGDDTNPTAKLIRQILAAVSEFERCCITLKLRGARERIKTHGRSPGAKNYSPDPILNKRAEGKKPFGHYPGENATLEYILRMRTSHYRTDSIAKVLNNEGYWSRSSKPWSGSTIRKILKNEASRADNNPR